MANRPWTLEESIEAFRDQEQDIARHLRDGEKYKHCIDDEFLGGACYDPIKVITSHGRVWSLRDNGFLDEAGTNRNAHGYLRTNISGSALPYNKMKTVTLHKLVACYFCDRKLIEVMEQVNRQAKETVFDLTDVDEHGNFRIIEVHHINSNKDDNRAENLQYIYTETHDLLTALHNKDNVSEVVRAKAMSKLQAVGLDAPEDRGIMILFDNATVQGNELYGYIERDNSYRGYHFTVKMKAYIKGDPNVKLTEAELIRTLAVTHGRKPDVVGTFSLNEETDD